MKRWMKIILALLGLPKSIWLNFRSLPLASAIRLPILVAPSMKIVSSRGAIVIEGKISLGMITFGLSGYGLSTSNKCVIQNDGTIQFIGPQNFGGGYA